MNETFMKEKPVFPLLLGMGMPMVLSMLVNSLYNIVDSYFVARISENAMEALSLVFPIQNFINAMAIGFGVGINALIATARGAGKENEARRAATQGVVLSVIHGILLAVICIVIMPKFLGMFTGDQEVIRYGVRYASVAFLFSPIIMAGLAFEKIFQAVGRMKVSMIALIGGCITNIILDPILIFGLAFFPKMGISGAAIATGVGQLISLVVYLAFYFRGPVPVKLEARYKIPGGNTMKKLYGIGIPAILNLALPSVMIFVLNGLLAQYSRSYVVILGIYYKLQTFLYFPASGIIQGMRPVIGYNFGAGERERVGTIYKTTLAMTGAWVVPGTEYGFDRTNQLLLRISWEIRTDFGFILSFELVSKLMQVSSCKLNVLLNTSLSLHLIDELLEVFLTNFHNYVRIHLNESSVAVPSPTLIAGFLSKSVNNFFI